MRKENIVSKNKTISGAFIVLNPTHCNVTSLRCFLYHILLHVVSYTNIHSLKVIMTWCPIGLQQYTHVTKNFLYEKVGGIGFEGNWWCKKQGNKVLLKGKCNSPIFITFLGHVLFVC